MKSIAPYALLATAILLGGCASSNGYDKASATSVGLAEAANSISRGRTQVDTTLTALNDLVNSPKANLTPQFQNYRIAVAKLDSISKEVSKNTEAMQKDGSAYFQTWDMELAKIHNEEIRSRSTERKAAVSAHFRKVEASYVRAKTDFAPFMSDLKDIQTALATDLTLPGINSIRSVARKASADASLVRTSLDTLAADFTVMGVELSPSTPVRK